MSNRGLGRAYEYHVGQIVIDNIRLCHSKEV